MKVKELIAALQAFNPEDVVCIEDADTDWHLNITAVRQAAKWDTAKRGYADIPGHVSLGGTYTDEIKL